MRTRKYEILRKNIPALVLYNAGQYWYDSGFNLVPWSGTTSPSNGDIVRDIKWYSDITYDIGDKIYYNGFIYESLQNINLNKNPSSQTTYWSKLDYGVANTKKGKYYKFSGSTWNLISEYDAYDDYQIPVFLESDLDELGVMVDFDGDIEQVEQLCNFTYQGNGNQIQIWNTASTNRLKKIVDATFEVNWGDGNVSGVTILSNVLHTYSTAGEKTIKITMNSPWGVQETTKTIQVPITYGYTGANPFGTLTFNVPYTTITGVTQNYINDYDANTTGYTGTTIFVAIGTSRIEEKKLYGSAGNYTGITTGTTTYEDEIYDFTGYTLDNMQYMDLSNGVTMISGNTASFDPEYVINTKLTRNEHFLGFVTDPIIYSDVFVERGKQSVIERNLRLGEIDNIGELDVYNNGYFNVRKQ